MDILQWPVLGKFPHKSGYFLTKLSVDPLFKGLKKWNVGFYFKQVQTTKEVFAEGWYKSFKFSF